MLRSPRVDVVIFGADRASRKLIRELPPLAPEARVAPRPRRRLGAVEAVLGAALVGAVVAVFAWPVEASLALGASAAFCVAWASLRIWRRS